MAARRLGRADWLTAAFSALVENGIAGVRVETLAKRLAVTKGSFYWHFPDRPALLAALLAEWEERATLAIIAAVEAAGGTAAERLLELFQLAFTADGRLDRRVRTWADDDATARTVLVRVDRRRLDYLGRLFGEMGFSPAQAAARSRLAYSTLIGDFVLGAPAALSERREEARLLHHLLSQA